MRDNFLIVGLLLGAVVAWLWFNKARPAGATCRTSDLAGGGGSSDTALLMAACGKIGGHWRPHLQTQLPGQPPTYF